MFTSELELDSTVDVLLLFLKALTLCETFLLVFFLKIWVLAFKKDDRRNIVCTSEFSTKKDKA